MSSTLQVGLAIAGGLILAGVVAHGAWQARKNAPRLPDKPPHHPPAPGPVEPALRPESKTTGFDSALPSVVESEKKPPLDDLIDAVAIIHLDGPVLGDQALVHLPATRRAGSKPFAIEGYNLAGRCWETPAPGRRYMSFRTGIQLANRTGALNDIEFSEFVVKTQKFADAVGGTPEFPDMLAEVARARELDHFASEHDAQLRFSVRAKGAAWSPGFIYQVAAGQGFVRASALPGKMALPAHADHHGAPLLNLFFEAPATIAIDPSDLPPVREVVISLDVPQVERSHQPFVRMREVAGALVQAMDGVVTDEAGQPLSSEVMDQIGADLEGIYDALAERDLAAGSVLARRLFS